MGIDMDMDTDRDMDMDMDTDMDTDMRDHALGAVVVCELFILYYEY